MERITLKEAARRVGYKSEKSFLKHYIETGAIPYHKEKLPNGRIRLLVNAELIEKRFQNNQYQYK